MCIRIVFSPAETAREKKEMKTYLAGRKVIGGIFFSFNVAIEREKSWCVSHYESLHMYSVLKNSKKGRSKYDGERQVTQLTSRQQSCRQCFRFRHFRSQRRVAVRKLSHDEILYP